MRSWEGSRGGGERGCGKEEGKEGNVSGCEIGSRKIVTGCVLSEGERLENEVGRMT